MSSVTESTLKQYDAPIKQWFTYCQSNQCDIYNALESHILEFLTMKYNEGSSFSTLNTARSAIFLVTKIKASQCPNIARFFKGIFKLRPTKPRYSKIWNTETVLSEAGKLFPLEELSLQLLTDKLVILLAIGTAHRVQTLSLITLDNIVESDTGVNIRITDPIKTTKAGSAQPNFFLPYFDKSELCLASTILHYIDITKELRKESKKLILCTKKPYKEATAQTISRWIRAYMRKCGIGEEYSAHSTRHASTSAALKKGLDVSIIKSTAGWSENCLVFARFYNRPIEPAKSSFMSTVFQ